jgi:hypothetical protein
MSCEDLESNGTNSTVQLNLSIERYLTGPPTTVQSPSGWSLLLSYLQIGSALQWS